MATYAFTNRGAALPYGDGNGIITLKRTVNLPALIADPTKLALAATPTVALTAFSGFVQNDILELWEVPAGTLIFDFGVKVSTAEGATAAATVGYTTASQTLLGVAGSAADPNAYANAVDLNSATTQNETAVALDGTTESFKDVYVTAGSIDMKFTTNDTYAVAVFECWAMVSKVY